MKIVIACICALFVCSATSEVVISCINYKVIDDDGYLIIRAGPSKQSDSIGFLKTDDVILVSDSVSSWPYIVSLPIYSNKITRGYVHRSRIKDAGFIEYDPKWKTKYLCATTITHPEERK